MKQFLFKVISILSIAFIAICLSANLLPALTELLENQTYYLRSRWVLGKGYRNEEIINRVRERLSVFIIDIDERSVSKDKLGYYGNWKRDVHARMIDSISLWYPAAVLFDICFHEPEDDNVIRNIENVFSAKPDIVTGRADSFLDMLPALVDFDRQFENSTQNAGNIIHGYSARNLSDFSDVEQRRVQKQSTLEWLDSLEKAYLIQLDNPQAQNRFNIGNTKPVIDGIFPSLARSAAALGHINATPNSDGIIREIPLVFKYGEHNVGLPALSIVAACKLFGTPDSQIVLKAGRYIDIGTPFKIRKDAQNNIDVSYPNFSTRQLYLLLNEREKFSAMANGSEYGVTSFCKVTPDTLTGKTVYTLHAGNIDKNTLVKLQEISYDTVVNMEEGSAIDLSDSVSISKESDYEWLIANETDELWLSATDIKTLFSIDTSQEYKKPELIFNQITISKSKKRGRYSTTIPVLSDPVFRELIKYSWEDILNLPAGETLEIGPRVRIPLNENNEHVIRYYGPGKTFPYYSYSDILDNRIQGNFDGKIFIAGSSLPNLFDIKPTPHDNFFPGVEIHASLLQSFIDNSFVKKTNNRETLMLVIALGVAATLVFSFLPPLWGSLALVIFIFLSFLYGLTVFEMNRIWVPVAQPVFTLAYSYIFSTAYRFLIEERGKKFLKTAFSTYLSPVLINDMYKKGLKPQLGGEEKEITAFFTDIQSFSSFSEQLKSPQKIVTLLNEYLSAMTDILLRNNGTLDKYEGDAIIAFFGAPLPSSTHAADACATALTMQNQLSALRSKWSAEGDRWPDIVKNMRMRIGINTGLAVTGNMGSNMRMNYTMIGDSVNLAARLESAAKQFGVFILAGEQTYESCSPRFEFRRLDRIKVVGKGLAINVYELIAEKDKLSSEEKNLIEKYDEAMELYMKRDFRAAAQMFTAANVLEPNRNLCKTTPSARMAEICEYYADNPPPEDWDGSNSLSSK